MHVSELDTPALCVDLSILKQNIHQLQSACNLIGIDLRVHTKTHKTPSIAQMQVEAGARGIVCQKLGEAEVMAKAGIADILIAYNLVGARKLERLSQLVRTGKSKITVTADSRATVEGLSKQAQADSCTFRVLVEMDTGGGRCGTQSPQSTLELAQIIDQLSGLYFAGVMTYPSSEQARNFVYEVQELLEHEKLPLDIISGGGTGSHEISKSIGCTETRIGSYVYEGMSRISEQKHLHPQRCPLRLKVTIVSVERTGQIIVDGGQKAFTSYPPTPYGYCLEFPEIFIKSMSVEHGQVDVSMSENKFAVGQQLSFIPLHGGMTTNLHDQLYVIEGEKVVDIWEVAGRGRGQ